MSRGSVRTVSTIEKQNGKLFEQISCADAILEDSAKGYSFTGLYTLRPWHRESVLLTVPHTRAPQFPREEFARSVVSESGLCAGGSALDRPQKTTAAAAAAAVGISTRVQKDRPRNVYDRARVCIRRSH